LGPIFAPSLLTFVLAGFVMGMTIGSMDVSMNAHGIAVEKALKRPTMSMLHAGFSIGGTIGAFVGAALLEVFGAAAQALVVASVCAAIQIAASRFYLAADVDKGLSGSHFAWPTRATIGLGLLCFLALMIEGSILDWAAIMMREKFLIDAGFAALGFGFYQAGMAVARLTGDWIRLRAGAVRMVTVECASRSGRNGPRPQRARHPISPSWPSSSQASASATCAPVLFAGGGRLEPDAPGRGIAAVTTLGYSGFLLGPPLIGFLAQVSSVSTALFLTVFAALIIAVFARSVRAADTY
jgi:hypothetical protein